jgi:hypothetical protein
MMKIEVDPSFVFNHLDIYFQSRLAICDSLSTDLTPDFEESQIAGLAP